MLDYHSSIPEFPQGVEIDWGIAISITDAFTEAILTHCVPFEPVKSWCVGTQPRVVQGQFLGDSSQGIGARERVRKYG